MSASSSNRAPENVLVLNSPEVQRQQIIKALAERQSFTELIFADTVDNLKTPSFDNYDIVILPIAELEDVLAKLSDYLVSPSLIVLYERDEEERAFAIEDHRVIDILPVRGISRLSIILERESKLRLIDTLRLSEARYRAVVEDQSDLIFRYTPDFRLTFVNRAYSQNSGKTPDELIGVSLFDMIPLNDRERVKANVLALSKDHPVTTSDYKFVLPDGSIRWRQWSDRAIFDEEGNIIEYQGIGRDITETKSAHNQLDFLYALTLATSTADSLDDAFSESMRLICEAYDWQYAEIWMPDYDRQLLTVGAPHFIHPADTGQLQAFWQMTQGHTFVPGSGIPGRAWSSQQPSWTFDVQQQSPSEFLRLKHARESGLHGIVAIPIVDKEQMLAVMLFMALRPLNYDEALLKLLTTALQQIAPIIRRQQINDELVISEERYRGLVENFDGVITITDTDGRYLFANEKAWKPFGLTLKKGVGKSIYDLFTSEIGDTYLERVQEVIETGQPRIDTVGMQVGPDYRWFRSILAPLRDPDGTINRVQSISFDVTDAKQAEQQLQQAQEIAHLGSWTLDFQTNETIWSDEFFKICGLEPGSVQETVELGFSLIHPDDRERAVAALADLKRTATPYNLTIRVVRPTGEIRWVISQGQARLNDTSQPIKLVGTFLDITERKQAELALELLSRRLLLLHHIDLSILASDSIDAIVTTAMEGLQEIIPFKQAAIFEFRPEERKRILFKLMMRDTGIVSDTPVETSLDQLGALDQEIMQAIMTEKYHLIQDLRDYPPEQWSDLREEGIHSVLSVGLKYHETLIGGLFIHVEEAGFFTDTYIEIATTIADQLAIGINTIEQNERIRRHNEELEARVLQRTAELELEQTRTDAILQSSSDGIVLLDEKLQIRNTNETFHTLFNCDDMTCVGSPLLDRIHSDDRELLQQQLEATIADHNKRRCEVRALRQDEQIVYIEVGIARVKQLNGDAPNLVCTIHDMTERKQAEARLAESEDRYRMTIESMSEGIVLQTREGKIQLANAAAERILGLTTDQLIGRTSRDPHWYSIREDGTPFPGEEHPAMVALHTGEPQHNVVMGVHKPDGTLTWIMINAQPIKRAKDSVPYAVVTTFADITGRKETEQQLRYLARLQEYMNESVISTDMAFNVQSWNKASERMFGWAAEEVLGKSVFDVLEFEFVGLTLEAAEQELMVNNFWSGEVVARHRDGQVIHILGSIGLNRDEHGIPIGVIGVNHDITERKEAEKQLRYLASLQEYMNDSVTSTDMTFRLQSWNKASERMFGWTAEEAQGQPVFELLKFEFPNTTFEAAAQDMMANNFWNGEITARHRDGQPVHVLASIGLNRDEHGVPIGAIGVHHDITERKEAEKQLEALSQRLQLATDAGGIGIWEWELVGDVLVWDQQMHYIFGVSPEQFSGKVGAFASALHPDDYDHVMDALNAALRGEKDYKLDFRIVRPDGGVRHLRARGIVLRDDEDKPERMIGTNLDITDERMAAEALQRALTQERELGQLKSRFVSMASHEFRTPLATISATTETLLVYRDRLDGEKMDARLHKILHQVDHMKDIMEDVLQLARIQAGRVKFNPEDSDLDMLCHDIIEEFESRSKYSGRIQYQSTQSPLYYHYDPRLMRQVISNLISNALKYSPPDQNVRVDLHVDATTITLKVQDKGIGIPEPDIKRLFDPFHRAGNVGTISGTGLGLSITREAVDLHGGSIQVETELNAGTTFIVTLPIEPVERRISGAQDSDH